MSDVQKKRVIEKNARRERAHRRLRQRVAGSAERPRLAIFKSERFVYAQVIDDDRGATLAAAASLEPELRGKGSGGANKVAAKMVGEAIAERAMAKGVKKVVFDRGGYRYHGKVKELAEAARAKGLEF